MAFESYNSGYNCRGFRGVPGSEQGVGSAYIQSQQLKNFQSLYQQRVKELNALYAQYGTDKTTMDAQSVRSVAKMEEIVNNLSGMIVRLQETLGNPGRGSR